MTNWKANYSYVIANPDWLIQVEETTMEQKELAYRAVANMCPDSTDPAQFTKFTEYFIEAFQPELSAVFTSMSFEIAHLDRDDPEQWEIMRHMLEGCVALGAFLQVCLTEEPFDGTSEKGAGTTLPVS
jgi:hypothetical protein